MLSPKRRIDLLGRLAEFPPPVSTRNLLALLDGLPNVHARDLRPAPRGWRDGLGSLYDARVRDRDAALELVLRYCMGVLAADRPFDVPSTRTATKSLWEWVKRVADEDLSGISGRNSCCTGEPSGSTGTRSTNGPPPR